MAIGAAIGIAAATLVLSPIAGEIKEKIKSTLKENLSKTLKGRLKALSRKVDDIHSKLLRVETSGTHADRWQQQIKEVNFDVEDLLADIEVEETRSKVHHFLSNLPDHEIIGDIKEKLIDLNKSLLNLIAKSVADEKRTEETMSKFEHDNLIGREEEKEEIVRFLVSENNEDNNTCSIVGIGGVGKTALAQVICQHEEVKKRLVVKWAHVGFKKFDLREILFRIGVKMETNSTLERQTKILQKSLGKKTCLFVLDDLWEMDQNEWLKLKVVLLDINQGNKVLITTRHQGIANMAAKDRTVFLKPLEPCKCLLPLIKKYVKSDDLLSGTIKKEIIKECEGVPMAAITLGDKLCKETTRVSDLWSTVDVKNKGNIMNSLKFSYDCLPRDYQNCFAYHVVCNGILHKERLTQMWTAQGFIKEPDDGNTVFEELKNASFFHDVEEHIFPGTQFKVLKLFRTLIFLVSKEYADTTVSRITDVPRSTLHVSLSPQRHAQEVQESRLLGQLRTVVGLPEIRLLSDFKGLRVLVLFDVEFESSDISFGNLTHLRYLDLSRNGNLEVLPESLGKLLFLRTLRVDMCEKLKALLPNENKLKNPLRISTAARKRPYFTKLETLEIVDCPRLLFQKDDMENLKNLKRLAIIKHPDLTGLPEGFSGLTSLERLTIEDCARLKMSSTEYRRNILPRSLKSLRINRCDELTKRCESKEGRDDVSWIKEVYLNGILMINLVSSSSSSSAETDVLLEGSNEDNNGNGEGSSTHPHQSDRNSIGKGLRNGFSNMKRKRR